MPALLGPSGFGGNPSGAWRSLVSALDWGSRGRKFESSRPDRKPKSLAATRLQQGSLCVWWASGLGRVVDKAQRIAHADFATFEDLAVDTAAPIRNHRRFQAGAGLFHRLAGDGFAVDQQ